MHFEVLVEDKSGEKCLNILIPKIIPDQATFRIKSYKGAGKIPKDLRGKTDPMHRVLLDRLPKLLSGYGKTYQSSPGLNTVIVVCDLDNKVKDEFLIELAEVLESCHPKPNAFFCLAIEEGEAWLLGDINAITTAYPNAKVEVLRTYVNDSICGTWELLAEAIYPGGLKKLCKNGYSVIGLEKSKWAENISPHINICENKSPSFQFFRETLKKLSSQS